jgi:3',5'-cyclic AMP phosphodiesterase CpdA
VLQLVHITDPHFGCEDKHALTAVAKYVSDLRPDAVIATGDISKDGLAVELLRLAPPAARAVGADPRQS